MIYWLKQLVTRPATHGKALAEVFVTAFFALLPLVITAVMYNVRNESEFDFWTVIKQAVGAGQLFLYAYGLLGSIFWLAFFKWERQVHAPRLVLGGIAIAVSYPIVALLGLDPSISNVRNTFLLNASWWAYGSFLLINYFLLFFLEIDPPAPEDSLRSGSTKLKDAYRKLGKQPNG